MGMYADEVIEKPFRGTHIVLHWKRYAKKGFEANLSAFLGRRAAYDGLVWEECWQTMDLCNRVTRKWKIRMDKNIFEKEYLSAILVLTNVGKGSGKNLGK